MRETSTTAVLDVHQALGHPVAARAMRLAVEGGREAYLAGRMGTRKYADPSSPLAGLI